MYEIYRRGENHEIKSTQKYYIAGSQQTCSSRTEPDQRKQDTTEELEKSQKCEVEIKATIDNYEKQTQQLERTIEKLNAGYSKALSKMTEERAARKRAEAEYLLIAVKLVQ